MNGEVRGRAVVHIGTPKSGTTFVQRAMWQQRDALRALDVHLPGDRAQDMFTAAIEVCQAHQFWGRDPEQIDGTWARLCADARAAGGTTVLSHELLSRATTAQVDKALAALDDLDVHVLVTVRDLGRQLMSSWQEEVKNGRTTSFDDYQATIMRKLRSRQLTGAFWRFQDVAGQLARWGERLPSDHVHVVVAPPSGAAPEVLWERYAQAVGFDPGRVGVPESGGRANETLGMEQVAALRRVNAAIDGRILNPAYARVVKRGFAQRVLAGQPGTRPQCPFDVVEELGEFAAEVNATLQDRGYRRYGELCELLPLAPQDGAHHPDDVGDAAEAAALAQAVAEVLVQQAQPRPRPGRGGQGPSPAVPRWRRLLRAARRRSR
jgi:hypothetical protein